MNIQHSVATSAPATSVTIIEETSSNLPIPNEIVCPNVTNNLPHISVEKPKSNKLKLKSKMKSKSSTVTKDVKSKIKNANMLLIENAELKVKLEQQQQQFELIQAQLKSLHLHIQKLEVEKHQYISSSEQYIQHQSTSSWQNDSYRTDIPSTSFTVYTVLCRNQHTQTSPPKRRWPLFVTAPTHSCYKHTLNSACLHQQQRE